MFQIQKQQLTRIYYKSHSLETGKTIVFKIWDYSGGQLFNSNATGEIGTKGVYYFDFESPNYDTYLLVKVGLLNGTYVRPIVIRCGQPAERLFYVDDNFSTGRNIAYEIYNFSGTIIKNGSLEENIEGFYNVLVNDLLEDTYFFKISPYTSKFTIPIDYEQGECVATVEYKYVMINVHSSYGGASKVRHSVFDYEGEARKKITASLIYDSDHMTETEYYENIKITEEKEKLNKNIQELESLGYKIIKNDNN